MKKAVIHPSQAPLFLYWLKERKGIFLWRSVDLGDIGASVFTPVIDKEGKVFTKPHWKYANKPSRKIRRAEAINVRFEKEVERWRVGLKRGYGFRIDISDASQRKMERLLEKHGEEAAYHFDYCSQEAVITVPTRIITLAEWSQENPDAKYIDGASSDY